MKGERAKLLLLDAGIIFLDILQGVLLFILVVITSPFWIFLGLCSILVEVYANCKASLDYATAMKELREREKEDFVGVKNKEK